MTGMRMPDVVNWRRRSIPDFPFRLISSTRQVASFRRAWLWKSSTELNNSVSKPLVVRIRPIPLSMLGSSSRTTTNSLINTASWLCAPRKLWPIFGMHYPFGANCAEPGRGETALQKAICTRLIQQPNKYVLFATDKIVLENSIADLIPSLVRQDSGSFGD